MKFIPRQFLLQINIMDIEEIKLLVIIILGLLALHLQTRNKKPAISSSQTNDTDEQFIKSDDDQNVVLKRQQQIDNFINQVTNQNNSILTETIKNYLKQHKGLTDICQIFEPSQPNFLNATYGSYEEDIYSEGNIKYKPYEQAKQFPTFNNTQSYFFTNPTLFNTPVQFNQQMQVQEQSKDISGIEKNPEKHKMISKQFNKQIKQKNLKKKHNKSYVRGFSRFYGLPINRTLQSQNTKKNKMIKHKKDKKQEKIQKLDYQQVMNKISESKPISQKIITKDDKGNILEIVCRFKTN